MTAEVIVGCYLCAAGVAGVAPHSKVDMTLNPAAQCSSACAEVVDAYQHQPLDI